MLASRVSPRFRYANFVTDTVFPVRRHCQLAASSLNGDKIPIVRIAELRLVAACCMSTGLCSRHKHCRFCFSRCQLAAKGLQYTSLSSSVGRPYLSAQQDWLLRTLPGRCQLGPFLMLPITMQLHQAVYPLQQALPTRCQRPPSRVPTFRRTRLIRHDNRQFIQVAATSMPV